MMCLRILLFPQNIVLALWSAVLEFTWMVPASQDTDFIGQEQLWVTRASARTYLQAVFGTPRQKSLVVEVRETQTQEHMEVIEQIAEHIKCNQVTKEQVRVLRDSLVSKDT